MYCYIGDTSKVSSEQNLFAAVARIEGVVAQIERTNGKFAKDSISDIPAMIKEAAAAIPGLCSKKTVDATATPVVESFGVEHVGQRLTANAWYLFFLLLNTDFFLLLKCFRVLFCTMCNISR